MVLCRFFLNLRQFSANSDVNDSTGSSPGSSFLRFASGIIGNLGEMLEEGSHALDDDLDCELDNPSDAEEFDITGDLRGKPSTHSDINGVQARMPIVMDEASRKWATHEGTAVRKLYDASECQTTTNVA